MLTIIIILLVVCILICVAFTKPRGGYGRVIHVIDGDTIIVNHNGKDRRMRLYGIDAPESDQEYGRMSTELLREKICNKDISFIRKGKDKYGRIIARVFLQEEDISLWMLRKGYAWYLEDFCKYGSYREAYLSARFKRKGLWSTDNPVNPKYFRKEKEKRCLTR